jgi:hypothetical protein
MRFTVMSISQEQGCAAVRWNLREAGCNTRVYEQKLHIRPDGEEMNSVGTGELKKGRKTECRDGETTRKFMA